MKSKDYTYLHEIDETTRLVAYPDYTNWDLFEILGDGLNIETISCADRLTEINYGTFKDELGSIKTRLEYAFDSYKGHALKLYLSIKGIAYVQKVLRGYSQGEWHEVLIYNSSPDEPSEWLHDEKSFEDLKAWYRGDVFTIETQKLEIYTNLRNGDLLEKWETIDSRSGVLITDETELAHLANDYELETVF